MKLFSFLIIHLIWRQEYTELYCHGSRYTLTSCSSGRGGEWRAAGGCAPSGGLALVTGSGAASTTTLHPTVVFDNALTLAALRKAATSLEAGEEGMELGRACILGLRLLAAFEATLPAFPHLYSLLQYLAPSKASTPVEIEKRFTTWESK